MKKILLCALCLLLLASCGKGQDGPTDTTSVGEAVTEETIAIPPDETELDLPDEIETAAEPKAKELSCALRRTQFT